MQTNPHAETPSERVQRIALAIHGITDRFSAHEEAFGRKLKESAVELIEETALYEIARTRDAAGTARLVHQLIERTEALCQLLSFVQHRGLVRSGVVEHINFELTELLHAFRAEDARFEEHVTRRHPHGGVVEARPEPTVASVVPPTPTPVPAASAATEPAEPVSPADPVYVPQAPADDFDPLLGPDDAVAQSGAQAPKAAAATTAVLEKVATPENLPTAVKSETKTAQPSLSPAKPANGGLTDRQRKILGIFDREKEAPLKRVMEVLPMFSEKTLRNDLNALRKAGKIKRVGKAPRSKYVLTD